MYTDNFCFGYIAVSCFFKNVWLAGVDCKIGFNENPVRSLDLDLYFGLRLMVFNINLELHIAKLSPNFNLTGLSLS